MRILSVTAQKPDSTGSGVYLSELVNSFQKMGHEQAVVAGVYIEDTVSLAADVELYPVFFKTDALPYPIAGMSDEMPYESTVYSHMTEVMRKQFASAFYEKLQGAVEAFKPDLILCHHLYYLTALVRKWFPNQNVAGVCHGTDLRQMKKHNMERELIKEYIRKLDKVFVLQENQQLEVQYIYNCQPEQVHVIGSGYNDKVFFRGAGKNVSLPKKLVFAGKLSEKKGVMSFLKSLNRLELRLGELEVYMAGGYGNRTEYNSICELAEACKYPVIFTGKLNQEELAGLFRQGDVFVLPSFYEGLPLVLIEALACGMSVVATDLPGIQDWMDANIRKHRISFVTPPQMKHADEPVGAELPLFEERLAAAIKDKLEQKEAQPVDVSQLSWAGVADKIIKSYNYRKNL